MVSVQSGVERFIQDQKRVIDLSQFYDPYPMQYNFHASPKPHRLLGGAAGPGKTLALIYDHLVACNEFSDPKEAAQVHTLLLRRTHPKLEATLITRFREKVPQELYKTFNEQKKQVVWLNGATTNFGSMQYEENAWDWQGQWLKIGYDEVCEFTFNQWNATSAWNRCPVSPYCTKDGAGNPIGVGSGWCKRLFVEKRPCDEMDQFQARTYNADEYEYFPCTYLDNPIYANDPIFLANLEKYTAPVRDALKYGKWGVAGGYFSGAWDPAYNVYSPDQYRPEWWDKRWISCDWGFEHWAAIYWHYMDEYGIVRTYKEKCVKHQSPEVLAETIVESSLEDGRMPKYQGFVLSHDAFSSRETATMGGNANSVAERMSKTLREGGIPMATPSTRDKLGREQLMYQQLEARRRIGEDGSGQPMSVAAWQIADTCTMLIDVIPAAPRDEKDPEKVAEFLGDDPLQGAGYGLYAIIGKPAEKPKAVQFAEHIKSLKVPDFTQQHQVSLQFNQQWKQKHKPISRPKGWR